MVVIVGVENEVDGTEISVLVCSDAEVDSTDVVTVGVEDDTQVHSLSEDKGMTFTCSFIDLHGYEDANMYDTYTVKRLY